MIEELKEEGIVEKAGGRFRLSTLIQKRLVALNAGARPLVNLDTNDKFQIVVQEIKQDKIFLDQESKVRTVDEMEGPVGGPPELDLENL